MEIYVIFLNISIICEENLVFLKQGKNIQMCLVNLYLTYKQVCFLMPHPTICKLKILQL
jgi:hypothetical protein